MASGATDYAELKLLDAILKNTTYTGGAGISVAITTTTLTDTETTLTGKEPLTGITVNYARQAIGTAWTSEGATAGHYYNTGAVTFGPASADWGTIRGVAICDSATFNAGNVLLYADLASPKSVLSGDSLTFAAGELDIYLA